MTSELDDAKLISTIKGAGADGIAVIKLMQANGDAISFKLVNSDNKCNAHGA